MKLLKDGDFWFVMYLLIGFWTAIHLSVDTRVECQNYNEYNKKKHFCVDALVYLPDAIAGVVWPAYWAHVALYNLRGGR